MQNKGLATRLAHLEHTMEETKKRFGSTSPIPIQTYLKATSQIANGDDSHSKKNANSDGTGAGAGLVSSPDSITHHHHHHETNTALGNSNIHDIANFVTMLTTRPKSPPRIPGGLPSRQGDKPTHHKQMLVKSWRNSRERREMELENQIHDLLETTIDKQIHNDIIKTMEREKDMRRESYMRR